MDSAKGSPIMRTQEAMNFHNSTRDPTGSTFSKFCKQGSLASTLMARLWTCLQGPNREVLRNPELISPNPCLFVSVSRLLWRHLRDFNSMSGIPDPLIPLRRHDSCRCMTHEEIERCRGNCAISFLRRLLCDDPAGPLFIFVWLCLHCDGFPSF